MCGIVGVYSFKEQAQPFYKQLKNAVKSLKSRGPDSNGTYFHNNIALGHTRLAIVDTSDAGNQPFHDNSGRYCIVFNGEFYNHKEYKKELINDGIEFKSESDTEVLLYLFIKYGADALQRINGCFAIAFYDSYKNEILLARDRMGINPLVYYYDKDKVIFASELKAILNFNISRELDYTALYTYFQLNYIPTNQCIIKNVHKLNPGDYAIVNEKGLNTYNYYKIPYFESPLNYPDYNQAKSKLHEVLSESVKRRLMADVPIGCFLSGGIDSSIITALASQHTKNLNTFSIGFKDASFFDETKYAELVAKKYNTNHTEFKISGEDILHKLFDIIDYFDEPFADSSALAVYILSKLTRQKATVALSGDGADEMFAGYNKHSAHFNASYQGIKEKLVTALNPLWKISPKSRNSKTGNFIRQLNRFAEGCNLSSELRYWHWASIGSTEYANRLIIKDIDIDTYNNRRDYYLKSEYDFKKINTVLYSDMKLVLQGDMLTKVDMMSMANSLEVRTPFLDHNVVDFTFSLPAEYKINRSSKKKLLKDTFRELLPDELISRPKHGFEVPLLNWLKNELWEAIDKKYLSKSFIIQQNIFNFEEILKLKKQIHSENPEDSHAKVWALLVFQNWWSKNIGEQQP